MLLFNDLRFAEDAKIMCHKNRARVSRPEWFKFAQILRKLKSQILCRKFGIYRQRRRQIIFSQTRGCMFIQAATKFADSFALNRQTSGMGMAAKFIQKVAA